MPPKHRSIAKYLIHIFDAAYITAVFSIDVTVLLLRSAVLILEALFRLILRILNGLPKKSLAGEVVLITGGGQGLGREMALEFSRRGVTKVVVLDIDQRKCNETAALVRKEGGKAYSYYCDVADQAAVQLLSQQISQEVGQISILVNNAAIMPAQTFLRYTPEILKKLIDVNTMSHFWLLQEYLPKMMQMERGHIVAISSIAGRVGTSYLVPYVATKFAVTGLMECLQLELKRTKAYQNIRFTTAFPYTLTSSLCKRPRDNPKYPFHKITPCDVAARRIIDGIQRNEDHVYIPVLLEYAYRLSHLFPIRVQQLVYDFINVGVFPDDE